MNKKLVFFGDLAPKYLAGTSIAARINLDILAKHFSILHVEENDSWGTEPPSLLSKATTTLGHIRKVFSLCKKETPTIFYTHLPSSSLGVLKIVALNFAVQVASDSTVILHLHRGDFLQNHRQSQLLRLLTKIVVHQTKLLFVLSEQHRDTLSGIFPTEKLQVLTNTIEQHPPIRAIKSDRISFIYISNYILEKGIIDLLEVFTGLLAEYPNITLDTYGNTLNPTLMSRIKSYDNGGSIRIHGKIEGTEKFQKIADSDCLVLPSWNEGQPLVILEAMSLGIPVIASDVGFVSEILGKNYSYLFQAKNREQLKTVLLTFLSESNDIGPQLQSRFKSLFGIRIHQFTLNNAIASVLARR